MALNTWLELDIDFPEVSIIHKIRRGFGQSVIIHSEGRKAAGNTQFYFLSQQRKGRVPLFAYELIVEFHLF